MTLIDDFLNIVFPKLCCICDDSLAKNEELLCFKCRSKLPKTMINDFAQNEFNNRMYGKLNVNFSVSYLYFHKSGITQELLHQLKYNRFKELGTLVGRWFAHELKENNILDGIDQIIPVPLHPKKKRKRGYNQSEYIAKGIAEVAGIATNFKSLQRINYHKSQTLMSKEQRWQIVQHDFKINEQQSVQDNNILLVDDILTTGSTMEACGLQLYEGGAKSVSMATIAIAK